MMKIHQSPDLAIALPFLSSSSCFIQSFLSTSRVLRALARRPGKQQGELSWQSWLFQLAPGQEAMGAN